MHEHHKEVAVLYHDKCPDGFGAAYAAWKKFGDIAQYIPMNYGDPMPAGLEGREVYVVDFCFEEMEEINYLKTKTKRLVVLDHHRTTKEVVESLPEGIYDDKRSGATISWEFFHPDTPIPRLLTYLEDGDTYRYSTPETRELFSYLLGVPYDFTVWDRLANDLEDNAKRAEILKKGEDYTELFNALAGMSIQRAKKVRFEGYEVLFVATHPVQTMRSYVGHELCRIMPPFALVVTAHPNGFGVSIRGDGSIDVSKIAEKYGGGGHPNASGFFVPNSTEMPWTLVEDKDK